MWEEELHVTCFNPLSIIFGPSLEHSVASIIFDSYPLMVRLLTELVNGQQFSGACVSIGPVWDLSLWHSGTSFTEDVTLALPLVQAHVKASWNQARDRMWMATHYGEWSTWPLKLPCETLISSTKLINMWLLVHHTVAWFLCMFRNLSSATGQSHCDTAAFAIDFLQALVWKLVCIKDFDPLVRCSGIKLTTTELEHIFKRYILCNKLRLVSIVAADTVDSMSASFMASARSTTSPSKCSSTSTCRVKGALLTWPLWILNVNIHLISGWTCQTICMKCQCSKGVFWKEESYLGKLAYGKQMKMTWGVPQKGSKRSLDGTWYIRYIAAKETGLGWKVWANDAAPWHTNPLIGAC